ncbi:MAG: nuclear transport factor 2 family protein [Acidobacteriia bacterium]|nr:nuclear transport factor 2 family protein [Terriglobia bacterium]
MALETAWNHALEVKDTKALEALLADTMVALDSDGSFSTRKEYLASIKAPDFQPTQAVNEENKVQV